MKTDTCEPIRDRIDRYLDDDLTRDERRSVELHLEECAACRDECDDARRIRDALRALPELDCPQTLAARILDHAGSAPSPDSDTHHRWFLPLTMSGAALAAACLVVVAAMTWPRTLVQPQTGPNALELALATQQLERTLAAVGWVSVQSAESLREDVIEARVVPSLMKPIRYASSTLLGADEPTQEESNQ